jgi:hypothetical protein
VPVLVFIFFRIHHHYKHVATVLTTEGETVSLTPRPIETIVLVGDVHRETMRLVEFAISLGGPWKAVHIAVNEDRVADVQRKWQERVGVGELVVLQSPYRSVTRPLHQYVKRRLKHNPGGFIHVVLGELRTGNAMTQVLHQNAHLIEQLALSDLDGVVTTVVPFPLESYEPEGWPHEEVEELVLPLPQPSSPQNASAQAGELPVEQLTAESTEVQRT